MIAARCVTGASGEMVPVIPINTMVAGIKAVYPLRVCFRTLKGVLWETARFIYPRDTISPLSPLYDSLKTGGMEWGFLKVIEPNKGNNLLFTTCWDVTQVRFKVFIQSEAPGSFLLVPRVAAVGVPPVQLWETQSGEGVRVRVLGIPRLALAPRFGHTDGPPVVHTCAVIALVIWKNTKEKSQL